MKKFLHLWVPIFLSNAIIMLSSLFDVIFLSHFSPQHVAALAVCLSVYSLCFVTGIGVLQGMMQELAEANGRQDYADIQRIVKQSILIVLVISAVAMYLLNHATPLLHFFKGRCGLTGIDCVMSVAVGLDDSSAFIVAHFIYFNPSLWAG